MKDCEFMDFLQTILTIIISLISGFADTIYLILLYSEISDHNFWIRKLYSNAGTFKICSKLLLESSIKEWSNSKYFLAENLNSNDLQVILNHYRNIDGFKRAFANEPDFFY